LVAGPVVYSIPIVCVIFAFAIFASTPKPTISYRVLKDDSNRLGEFLTVLVDESATKQQVLDLADRLYNRIGVQEVVIYDDVEAFKAEEWEMKQIEAMPLGSIGHDTKFPEYPGYPDSKIDLHMLVSANKATDKTPRWIGEGRNH
jgi:hypothetical protein